MKYTIGEKKNGQVTIEFELDSKEWEAEVEKAYQKHKGEYKKEGFRQGKVPRKVLEQTYGPYVFYEDAFNDSFPEYYTKMLDKEKQLFPVDYPDVKVTKMDEKGLKFTATVTLLPEVTLGEYSGIEVTKKSAKATDAEVKRELEEMQQKQARYVEITDRPAKMGDLVNIDFAGSIDGDAFEGGTAKDYELELGSHSFIAGFEEQVVGMKIDEQKDVKVEFPKEYPAKNLAGKPAVFAVKLLAIREKQVPEIDDKFASDVSEFNTLEELKKDTKEKIKKEKEADAERSLENKLVEEVVKNAKVEVPKVMVTNQISRNIEDMKRSLAMQGLSYELYLGYIGMTDETFRKSREEETEKQIKTTLVLSEIVKKEGIKAEESEIEDKINELAEKMKKTADELKKTMTSAQREVIENNIISEKVIKLLKEKNNIK